MNGVPGRTAPARLGAGGNKQLLMPQSFLPQTAHVDPTLWNGRSDSRSSDSCQYLEGRLRQSLFREWRTSPQRAVRNRRAGDRTFGSDHIRDRALSDQRNVRGMDNSLAAYRSDASPQDSPGAHSSGLPGLSTSDVWRTRKWKARHP